VRKAWKSGLPPATYRTAAALRGGAVRCRSASAHQESARTTCASTAAVSSPVLRALSSRAPSP
jgi:hypothetical protein